MTSTFLSLVLAPILLSSAPVQELHYNGSLTMATRDGDGAPVKDFTIYCLLAGAAGGEREIGFLVDERGGGGWAWPERFGLIKLDARNRATNQARLQVLHDHNGTLYPLPLPHPIMEHADKLAPDATWTVEDDEYSVRGKKKIGGRECWQVEVVAGSRPLEMLSVDAQSGLVVASERRVFMGRGDQFTLKIELDSAKEIAPGDSERLGKPLNTLVALQAQLKRGADATEPDLTEAQLASAAGVLDQLEQEAAETPFARLAAVISRDVKSQRDRGRNVAGLAEKVVGQKAPEFELTHLGGEPVDREQHGGKIIVLHFWKYHNDPLVEPYGQVGYLDFLYSRRGKLGVAVFGVAVDERFASPEKRSAALRQTRAFQEFMNVGYPVTADDGTLLAKFGDPRKLGAKLPLWVVIGADGRVAHYHAGYYDLKPDEGLIQLDGIIAELLKMQRAAKE